jgi:ubiquinone/menaquinone biosynthesis C-methylase UbiE
MESQEIHWEHLSALVPGLARSRILDLGAGKGSFLVYAASQGAEVTGLELSPSYIEIAQNRAKEAGVTIALAQGRAEELPFPDQSFDFVNASEVIEHVQDPDRMLKELRRVLRSNGKAYMSVPNRFGFKDPHFRLFFVNWLPRAFADFFISLFGTHKDYADTSAGHQRLGSMHYYTYDRIKSLLDENGFTSTDIRWYRITHEFNGLKRLLARCVYPLLRTFYFDTFHLLLESK